MSAFYSPPATGDEDFLFANLCDDEDWMFPVLDDKETSMISDSLEGQLVEGYEPMRYTPPPNTESNINSKGNSPLYTSSSTSTSHERSSKKVCKRGSESSSATSSSRGEHSSKTSTPNAFTVEIIPQSLTANQLAAATGSATVAFNFPSVDIFPAQIGGPWNDGSDDEADDCFDDSVEGDNITKKKGKKRVRPLNPDADLIAAATEASLLQMNIDPESKEGKRQKKVIRNRMSAQMHRERKKAYISYLESIVKNREAKIIELQERSAFISKENDILRNQLAAGGGGNGASDNASQCAPDSISASDEGGVTSDDAVSVSSKSSLSTASSSMHTSHHPKMFKSALSLLSIAMMACFTMYSSPGGPTLIQPVTLNVSPMTAQSSSIDSSSHASLVEVLSPLSSIFDGAEDAAMDMDNGDSAPSDSVPMQGRRLLSISHGIDSGVGSAGAETKSLVVPYSSALDTSASGRVISSIFTSRGLGDDHMSISENLLWNKYLPEGNAVQLYPRIPNISVVKKKTHLRSRYNDSDTGILLEGASQPPYYSSPSNSNVRQLDTASRVLMHSGRALLDPSLSGAALAHLPAGPVTDSTKAVSTYVKKEGSDSSSDGVGGGGHTKTPLLSMGMDGQGGGSNVLYMLLPASQIRWGKSLDDSHSSENIFSGLNYSIADAQNAFVEIGCTVFKAEIIKNVSFQE